MTAWEVGTGQRPFENLTMGQLIKKVFVKEERPSTADFEDGLKQPSTAMVWSAWMNRSGSLCKGVVEQMRRGVGSR